MNAKPSKFSPSACVFDAYGTIFDFGSAVRRRAAAVGDSAAALIETWRSKQLQYTWLRSLQGQYVSFEQVTADALAYALEAVNIQSDTLHDDLLALYRTPDAFPDAVYALRQLRAAGLPSWILSNGTLAMLGAAVRAAGLESLLDGVLSVESVGVYKTDPRVYQLAVDRLGVEADRIAFVSANGWDAFAAAQFGFSSIWCNRTGQPSERLPGKLSHSLSSLDALPGVLDGDRQSQDGAKIN
jgi:2-haloacid dehalogenase